jgi:transposase
MLSRWIYEYQTHGEDAFSGNGVPIRNADWEIKRLQKRLEELEMENEILKKFQAYWKGVEKSNTDSSRKTQNLRSEGHVPPVAGQSASLLRLV